MDDTLITTLLGLAEILLPTAISVPEVRRRTVGRWRQAGFPLSSVERVREQAGAPILLTLHNEIPQAAPCAPCGPRGLYL